MHKLISTSLSDSLQPQNVDVNTSQATLKLMNNDRIFFLYIHNIPNSYYFSQSDKQLVINKKYSKS